VAFWRKDGAVQAGMNVNVWDVVEPIKELIGSRQKVDVERLRDPGVPIEELATAAAG
jgi:3-phenylpropionate/trans-cinnamate dioxygenase ferredoxin reductase component